MAASKVTVLLLALALALVACMSMGSAAATDVDLYDVMNDAAEGLATMDSTTGLEDEDETEDGADVDVDAEEDEDEDEDEDEGLENQIMMADEEAQAELETSVEDADQSVQHLATEWSAPMGLAPTVTEEDFESQMAEDDAAFMNSVAPEDDVEEDNEVEDDENDSVETLACKAMCQTTACRAKCSPPPVARPDVNAKEGTVDAHNGKSGLPLQQQEKFATPMVREEMRELRYQNAQLKMLLNRAVVTEEKLAEELKVRRGDRVHGFNKVFGKEDDSAATNVFGKNDIVQESGKPGPIPTQIAGQAAGVKAAKANLQRAQTGVAPCEGEECDVELSESDEHDLSDLNDLAAFFNNNVVA